MALSIDQIITASWPAISHLFGERYHLGESFQAPDHVGYVRYISHVQPNGFIFAVGMGWEEDPRFTENEKISIVKDLFEAAAKAFREHEINDTIEETSDEE